MRQRVFYFVCALVFFLSFVFSASYYKKALDINSPEIRELSVINISLGQGSLNHVSLKDLSIGSRYVAVLESGLEAKKLQTYKLPLYRDALPEVAGRITYKSKTALEEYSSELDFSTSIISRLGKTAYNNQFGNPHLILPITYLNPISSEDFLEVNYTLEKGSLAFPVLKIYKVEGRREILLFCPFLLMYLSFVSISLASGFLFICLFDIPKKGTFYSFVICLFFGLIGFDALILGKSYRFLIKLTTLGGFGMLYALDLGREFYWFVLKRE